jgi:hypothetical protein
MGLDSTDSKPKHMSLPQAYENIRRWYTQNLPLLRERPAGGDYVQRSRALIRALPPASALNDLEIRAVHQTDGQHKMAAYAHGALEAAGLQWSLADTEKQQLKGSTLWPYLSISR